MALCLYSRLPSCPTPSQPRPLTAAGRSPAPTDSAAPESLRSRPDRTPSGLVMHMGGRENIISQVNKWVWPKCHAHLHDTPTFHATPTFLIVHNTECPSQHVGQTAFRCRLYPPGLVTGRTYVFTTFVCLRACCHGRFRTLSIWKDVLGETSIL